MYLSSAVTALLFNGRCRTCKTKHKGNDFSGSFLVACQKTYGLVNWCMGGKKLYRNITLGWQTASKQQ